MTLAIAHKEKDVAVLDVCERCGRHFRPESVTTRLRHHVEELPDQQGHWRPICWRMGGEQFRSSVGSRYEPAEQAKSDIYQDFLPLINSGKVELLDLAKLEAQFVGLGASHGSWWPRYIDHAPGGHDDLVNSACGALLRAGSHRPMKINAESLRKLLASPPMPGMSNYRPPRS